MKNVIPAVSFLHYLKGNRFIRGQESSHILFFGLHIKIGVLAALTHTSFG